VPRFGSECRLLHIDNATWRISDRGWSIVRPLSPNRRSGRRAGRQRASTASATDSKNG